jgi:UDP-glucose 4-epimerase
MNVLVTGGAGYVGSTCSAQLMEAGHRVVIVDDLSTGHAEAVPAGAHFIESDFGDIDLIRDLVKRFSIDAVMHFAGETLVGKSMTDPQVYFQVNVVKALAFLDTLLACGVKRFVFSSSAAIYGEPQSIPIVENHPARPVNAYGESKLMFERILDWYGRAYQLDYAALRYFNAAGANGIYGEDHDPETHLLPRLLHSLRHAEDEFVIYGDDYPTRDGTCIRDYVHVLDIAQAHIRALEAIATGGRSGAYNIGTSHGHSVREVLQAVEEVTGIAVRHRIGPKRAGDPAVLVASNEKLIRELGWRAQYSQLQHIIRSAWDWLQNYPGGYRNTSQELVTGPSR